MSYFDRLLLQSMQWKTPTEVMITIDSRHSVSRSATAVDRNSPSQLNPINSPIRVSQGLDREQAACFPLSYLPPRIDEKLSWSHIPASMSGLRGPFSEGPCRPLGQASRCRGE